jgi:hypothetical protein
MLPNFSLDDKSHIFLREETARLLLYHSTKI